MKKNENTGGPNNEQKSQRLIEALKRDLLELKGSNRAKLAQVAPRVDEVHKLGCSIRKLAKGIGFDESEVRHCLKNYPGGDQPAAKNEPPQSELASMPIIPTLCANTVISKTESKPESAEVAAVGTSPVTKELKTKETALKDMLGREVELLLPRNSEPAGGNQTDRETSIPEPPRYHRILEGPGDREQDLLDAVRRRMDEYRRLGNLTAEDMRSPESRRAVAKNS